MKKNLYKARDIIQKPSGHALDKINIPADVYAGTGFCRLVGNRSIEISGHKVLKEYTDEKIVIGFAGYDMTLNGEHLTMDFYGKEALLIKGNLTAVAFGKA